MGFCSSPLKTIAFLLQSQKMSNIEKLAEHVAGIKDFIQEILVRVPAKSVTRFKLVSKEWFSIISDTKFVQSHIQRNIHPTGMLIQLLESQETYFFSLAVTNQSFPGVHARPSLRFLNGLLGDGYKSKVLQSCSGLFLCRYTEWWRFYHTPLIASNLCVCNPTTKQYRFLPAPVDSSTRWSAVSLAFDPSVSFHYKVYCVKYDDSENKFQAEVYSSENHLWRPVVHFKESVPNSFVQPFLVGHTYFLVDLESDCLVRLEKPSIHRVVDEAIMNVANTSQFVCILSRDKLYVHELSRDYRRYDIKFKYVVDLHYVTSVYPEIAGPVQGQVNYKFCILDVVDRLPYEESNLILGFSGNIISYSFRKKTVKTVCNLPMRVYETLCSRTFQFTETMYSV